MRLELFFVLVVLCFINITYVDGLKANDTGVCVVNRSVKKTQRRVFIVKYKCGRKICTTRRSKIKENIVTQNDTLCCKGYTYSSESDVCTPLCSRGCIGGRCTAPDICECDPPSILDQDQKNVCYLPRCDPPCVNGQCVANNTCSCSDGYENINNTCQPKCDKCQNGRCISPNNCECFEGFTKQNGTCSRPLCKPQCINGVCKENNTCLCRPGYEKINGSSICQPKCNKCQNGRCISPNKCECLKGYTKRDGVCSLPLCQPLCVNGLCRENNILCTCLNGYKKVNNTCQPKCEECQNGRCISPNKCECLEGYTKRDGVCSLPLCQPLCVNGLCRENNILCTCLDGYKKVNNTCQPKCEECQNGRCISPNKCECLEGYTKRDGVCSLPLCQPLCVNGLCRENNILCTCLDGYKKVNNTCQPKCEECQNGRCISPNNCICFEGYAKSDGVCKPLCKNVTSNECRCVTYRDDITSCFRSCQEDCVVCDLNGQCRKNDCGTMESLHNRRPQE